MAGNDNGKGLMFVGTYTQTTGSKGIYVYDCDYRDGTIEYRGFAEAVNPSYLALNETGTDLYAVSEGDPSGVISYALETNEGRLLPGNFSQTSGEGLCNLVVSPDGRYILTANYGSGSVSVFEIQPDGLSGAEIQRITYEGSGPVSDRQGTSHIHCVRFCPCGKYVFITDLGNDAIYRYEVSGGGAEYVVEDTKKVFNMAPGSGPRHFVFDPEGKHMYLSNELSSSVSVFTYSSGEIKEIQTVPASRTGTGDGGDIKISADGKSVYMSIRENGDDGIAIFSRNPQTGILHSEGYVPCVEHPRNFEFTPTGKFLFVAGMKAGKLQVFERLDDGTLRDTGKTVDVPSPTCIVFT